MLHGKCSFHEEVVYHLRICGYYLKIAPVDQVEIIGRHKFLQGISNFLALSSHILCNSYTQNLHHAIDLLTIEKDCCYSECEASFDQALKMLISNAFIPVYSGVEEGVELIESNSFLQRGVDLLPHVDVPECEKSPVVDAGFPINTHDFCQLGVNSALVGMGDELNLPPAIFTKFEDILPALHRIC